MKQISDHDALALKHLSYPPMGQLRHDFKFTYKDDLPCSVTHDIYEGEFSLPVKIMHSFILDVAWGPKEKLTIQEIGNGNLSVYLGKNYTKISTHRFIERNENFIECLKELGMSDPKYDEPLKFIKQKLGR